MDKILRAFAVEQLQMSERTETKSPRHKQLSEEGYKLYHEIREKLSGEEEELLERLLDVTAEEKSLYAEDQFIRGYRLGVLMTMEIFAEEDKLLSAS